MRRWLILIVAVMLLVTTGGRVAAIQEQTLALRQVIFASTGLYDAQAETIWDHLCDEAQSRRSEVSCLWLYLGTEGDRGRMPRSGLDPELWAMYAYGFGWLAEEAQAIDCAVFSYELSLQLAPNHLTADRLTRLLLQEGRQVEAVVAWDQTAAALPSDDPEHWWALGQAAELRQDWRQSAWAYGQGGRLSETTNPRIWMRQGEVFRRFAQWEEAELAYHRALSIRADYYVPYFALGRVNYEQSRYSLALRWLGQSMVIRPAYLWNNYYIGQALHRMGKTDVGVAFLSNAVDLNPGQPWRWAVQLGDWRLALGDSVGALEAYQQALEWKPGETSIQERIEQAIEMDSG